MCIRINNKLWVLIIQAHPTPPTHWIVNFEHSSHFRGNISERFVLFEVFFIWIIEKGAMLKSTGMESCMEGFTSRKYMVHRHGVIWFYSTIGWAHRSSVHLLSTFPPETWISFVRYSHLRGNVKCSRKSRHCFRRSRLDPRAMYNRWQSAVMCNNHHKFQLVAE